MSVWLLIIHVVLSALFAAACCNLQERDTGPRRVLVGAFFGLLLFNFIAAIGL